MTTFEHPIHANMVFDRIVVVEKKQVDLYNFHQHKQKPRGVWQWKTA